MGHEHAHSGRSRAHPCQRLRPLPRPEADAVVLRRRYLLDRRMRDLRDTDGGVAFPRHDPSGIARRAHARARARGRYGAARRVLGRRSHAQHPRPFPRPRATQRRVFRPGPQAVKTIEIEPTFESWQAAARALLRDETPPAEVRWREASNARQPSLPHEPTSSGAVKVPRQFLELARQAAAASDPARWQILYDVLWRLVHEHRDLLKDPHDPGNQRPHGLLTPKTARPHRDGAAPPRPPRAGPGERPAAAARCTGCDLYRQATQTVFGHGSAEARIGVGGEPPGEQEDRQSAPL